MGEQSIVDVLFVEKWGAVLEALENRTVGPLWRFRQIAADRRHWESVREVDRHSLDIEYDENLFRHLLFGTPFESFRETLRKDFPGATVDTHYVRGKSRAVCLDIASGLIGDDVILPVGEQSHVLLEILSRDFYRPLRTGALFAELFPNEHFDIASSPNRVHQAVKRARALLVERRVSLGILENRGDYRLSPERGLSLRVPYRPPVISAEGRWIENLRQLFGPATVFRPKEARLALGLSETSFHRLAVSAEERGWLKRDGRGPATRYRFVKAA